MEIHTLRKVEYVNVKEIVDSIERKFRVDPAHRDWKNRGEINIRCINCKDKKFHLGLSFAKNAYNCFRCDFQGHLDVFLRTHGIKFESKNQAKVAEVTCAALKMTFPRDFQRNEEIARKARAYLIERGFDLNFVLKNFKMWPITDVSNHYFGYIVAYLNDYAFYARRYLDLDESHLKHIIRKSDREMKLFYSYEKNNSSTLLVVESFFNLMKAAQFGYDAVCIFGKGKWSALVEYLKSNENDRAICLCFDSDVKMNNIESFVNKVQKNYKQLDMFYIDPADMPCNDIAMMNKEDLIKTINKKKNTSDMFINMFSLQGVEDGSKARA